MFVKCLRRSSKPLIGHFFLPRAVSERLADDGHFVAIDFSAATRFYEEVLGVAVHKEHWVNSAIRNHIKSLKSLPNSLLSSKFSRLERNQHWTISILSDCCYQESSGRQELSDKEISFTFFFCFFFLDMLSSIDSLVNWSAETTVCFVLVGAVPF